MPAETASDLFVRKSSAIDRTLRERPNLSVFPLFRGFRTPGRPRRSTDWRQVGNVGSAKPCTRRRNGRSSGSRGARWRADASGSSGSSRPKRGRLTIAFEGIYSPKRGRTPGCADGNGRIGSDREGRKSTDHTLATKASSHASRIGRVLESSDVSSPHD